MVPKFKMFNGIGNLHQHIAHFKASCGDSDPNGLLLLRQFVQSLIGVAFERYFNLSDHSIQTCVEMEQKFKDRFATGSNRINVADLVAT